jgi:type II restriction enzyme
MISSQKENIKNVICVCLREKLTRYPPESISMPFHYRLLGKDRMALYGFIRLLNTSFGVSIFEPIAAVLAKDHFAKVQTQCIVGDSIFSDCQEAIQHIMNRLSIGEGANKTQEIDMLRKSLTGKKNAYKTVQSDLCVETDAGERFLFDLKTAKPNISSFKDYKRTLLEWAGIALTRDNNARIHTLIAIPYNPYEPKPYERWTMRGMLDLPEELKVGKEFWDFLGGDGAYEELLDCFEEAGGVLRPEIDAYFARFK